MDLIVIYIFILYIINLFKLPKNKKFLYLIMWSTREGLLCPHRIVDDIGSGFGLGLMLGSMWNFMKGVYSSPSKERVWGGIMLAKRRAPITGGNFAAWMGLFGFWQCSLLYVSGQDTHTN